jgi:hypothetical protein
LTKIAHYNFAEVDGDDFVVEWDLCLDDCPHESPEIVCLEDPEFPHLIIVTGRTIPIEVNFTTNYERGKDLVTAELDYVEFECPEGYVFKNTTASAVYAICHNWTWKEMSAKLCFKKFL